MENAARKAALEALERCRRDGAWSASSLDAVLKKYALEKRDAALAARLCLGVMQNSVYCDHYIALYSARRVDSLQPKLRDILRLGTYQLLFLDRIPARAAVSEAVALCKSQGCARAAGLVNAVLRRIADNINSLPPIPGEGTAGVVIYDDKFAYSHHATDPAHGRLLNLFDLIRIHIHLLFCHGSPPFQITRTAALLRSHPGYS